MPGMSRPLSMCRNVSGVGGMRVSTPGCRAMPNGRHIAMESLFMEDIMRGKVALITGDGSRIEFEISTQFGQHGASIAIMGRGKQVLDSIVSTLQSLGINV
ncbi:hypothetical protein Q3G72_013323 [Acer saccharum]|nr:hypothetical protein Q3G72_013323 [Acer saccharum]